MMRALLILSLVFQPLAALGSWPVMCVEPGAPCCEQAAPEASSSAGACCAEQSSASCCATEAGGADRCAASECGSCAAASESSCCCVPVPVEPPTRPLAAPPAPDVLAVLGAPSGWHRSMAVAKHRPCGLGTDSAFGGTVRERLALLCVRTL